MVEKVVAKRIREAAEAQNLLPPPPSADGSERRTEYWYGVRTAHKHGSDDLEGVKGAGRVSAIT